MRRRDFISFLTLASSYFVNSRLFAFARRKKEGWLENTSGIATESPNSAENGLRWDFNQWDDRQGWTVPSKFTGAVMGGGLWLTLSPAVTDPNKIEQPRFQIIGDRAFITHYAPPLLESPAGLKFPASHMKKVRLRILNLSPETDGYLYWRTTARPDKDAGPVRFTMRPDLKQWQEIVCHIDSHWIGTIDQIKLGLALTAVRGDIWIDRIEITDGTPRALPPRPDICSDNVVPRINLPGVSQEDFHDAFNVLNECLITNVPVFGFNYPVMGPGGAYGENWWQLDSSLAIAGAKWANQEFAENVMRGFKGVQDQNPDGRIDLYGGSAIRGQIGDASSLPRFFEVAYNITRRTGNEELRQDIYLAMKNYLDWWLSPVKRDTTTGLITAVFEETFSGTHQTPQDYVENPQTLAPMDLNVAVALGCNRASVLADHLGKEKEAGRYKARFEQLRQSINRYLWDKNRGAYYNYDVKKAKHRSRLICTTFDPLRLRIAPSDRVGALIPKLLNPGLFNWGKLPVTSIAKTDPDYTEGNGPYNGSQWLGDVWAMRNVFIVAALEDVGRHDLAAELAWATIKAFNGNYTEYLISSTGQGDGVKRYAWSASLYIAAVIEHLFGVDYDRIRNRLRILPRVPTALLSREIYLEQLIIPSGGNTRLSVKVSQSQAGQAEVSIEIQGALPEGEMEVLLPKQASKPARVMNEGRSLPLMNHVEGLTNVIGVRMPIQSFVRLQFEE